MTILTVKHVTTYSYAAPVRLGGASDDAAPARQRRPAASQRDPRYRTASARDFAGFTTSSTIASPSPTSRGTREVFGSRATSRSNTRRSTNLEFLLEERARFYPFSYDAEEMPDLARDDRAALPRHRPANSTAGLDDSSIMGRPTETGTLLMTLDQRDQGRAFLRTSHREGNAKPVADAGVAARLLPRFRDADDGGGASAGARRPLRLRLSLRARSRLGRALSRRRLDARVVPSLPARRRLGRIRSDQRHCRQSRSHPGRGRARRPAGRSRFTGSISATPRTKRGWSSRSASDVSPMTSFRDALGTKRRETTRPSSDARMVRAERDRFGRAS